MTQEKKEMNKQIEVVRRHIEHAFGRVKFLFRLFAGKFRHSREWVTPLWRFICGMTNLIHQYEVAPANFPTSWEKEIPHVEKPELYAKVISCSFVINSFLILFSLFVCPTANQKRKRKRSKGRQSSI